MRQFELKTFFFQNRVIKYIFQKNFALNILTITMLKEDTFWYTEPEMIILILMNENNSIFIDTFGTCN